MWCPILLLGLAPRWVAPKTSGLLLSFKSCEGAEDLNSDTGISSSCWLNLPSGQVRRV